jgi:hypothetical protein
VPVHFAIAACGEAHLDASNVLRRGKDDRASGRTASRY